MKIITAREAFENDLTRYFTGKICKNGHIAERMISNGSCVECLKEKRNRSREDIYEATKVWRLKNPESRRIEAEKYRKKYPEKVKQNSKNYRKRNIDKVRERDRLSQRRLRAINPEKEKERLRRFKEKKERERIFLAGRNKPEFCEICGENKCRIVFDHCHVLGHFRGWICDRCNKVLGLLKDSPALLRKMIKYLERNNGKTDIKKKE